MADLDQPDGPKSVQKATALAVYLETHPHLPIVGQVKTHNILKTDVTKTLDIKIDRMYINTICIVENNCNSKLDRLILAKNL